VNKRGVEAVTLIAVLVVAIIGAGSLFLQNGNPTGLVIDEEAAGICGNNQLEGNEKCDPTGSLCFDGSNPGLCSFDCKECNKQNCPFCKNGICEPQIGENKQTCPQDCGTPVCGNGACEAPEASTGSGACPQDCPDGCDFDGACEPKGSGGENSENCADCVDMPTCGNGLCQPPETAQNCPNDCCAGIEECETNADCNDSDACTDDVCDNGSCVNNPIDCNDDDVCTTDSCNPFTGCVNEFQFSCDPFCPSEIPETTCDDGLDNDCDGPIDCEDSDCFNDPFCQECDNNEDCDDNDVCNGIETCVDFTCQSSTPLDCDDDIFCTDDSCNPLTGCINTPNNANCNDNDICTIDICDPGEGDPFTGCINTFQFSCPNCPEEDFETKCSDQIDNDCDGSIDCEDSDCFNDPACVACDENTDCEDENPCTLDLCIENTCQNNFIDDPDGDGIPSGPLPGCCVAE